MRLGCYTYKLIYISNALLAFHDFRLRLLLLIRKLLNQGFLLVKSKSSHMTYDRVCNKSSTTDVTRGAGTGDPSGVHELILDFQ